MDPRYQLVWLGAEGDGRRAALEAAIGRGIDALGLASADFLVGATATDSDWRFPVVGVFFGADGSDPAAADAAVDTLLDHGCPVFPVVDDLDRFSELVPERLRRINGAAWPADEARLASEVLRAFGLARRQRSAFISYRRANSREAAVQLFHRLNDCGYRPFLDTVSIDLGLDFQESLWDRMSDVDLLIFLDTPKALTSQWVEQELTRAHNLGLGILQLVWPGHKPFDGTELAERFRLATRDFEPIPPPRRRGEANPDARLRATTLDAIAKAAEDVRIRSLGSRRERILSEIVGAAAERGFRADVDPAGIVSLECPAPSSAQATARAIVGLPVGQDLYEAAQLPPSGSVRLVYDGLGIRPERRGYLDWLNVVIPAYKTLPVDRLDEWLDGL